MGWVGVMETEKFLGVLKWMFEIFGEVFLCLKMNKAKTKLMFQI